MPSSGTRTSKSAPLIADLSSSFDHSPWAVTASSGEAHLLRYANPAFCRLIGKERDEVIGRPFDGLAGQTDEFLALIDRVYETGAAASFTAEDQAGAYPLFFSYTLWPVIADGRTAGVMIQVNETGPLHETRQAISQALLLGALHQHELVESANLANTHLRAEVSEHQQLESDAKLLTNEVSHRIKNNLQVVVALIANEIKRTPAPWAQGFVSMRDRILAIAQLYELISQSSRSNTVALDVYLKEIAQALTASLLVDPSGIRIAVEVEALQMDSDRAVSFGLLVNELATNAVKHAFPGGSGVVTLAVRGVADDVELTVTDDGIGMPAHDQAKAPGKHGTDYVAIFVRQLQGEVVRSGTSGVGTRVRVRFPLSVADPEV